MVGIAESLVYAWYDRSSIDYRELFMRLYVSYNAWFRKTTSTHIDYEAIKILKTRFVIWDDYVERRSMVDMQSVMLRIVKSTQKAPLQTGGHWKGVVQSSDDWKGLIDYWYQIRCDLFHGYISVDGETEHIRLAYESLYIFMSEIVSRMRSSFKHSDMRRLEELKILTESRYPHHETYQNEALLLHQKFIHSPDLWNVDMVRARKE